MTIWLSSLVQRMVFRPSYHDVIGDPILWQCDCLSLANASVLPACVPFYQMQANLSLGRSCDILGSINQNKNNENTLITLTETNSSHLKAFCPKRERSYSNHPFSAKRKPSIFRCKNVSFRESRLINGAMVYKLFLFFFRPHWCPGWQWYMCTRSIKGRSLHLWKGHLNFSKRLHPWSLTAKAPFKSPFCC